MFFIPVGLNGPE